MRSAAQALSPVLSQSRLRRARALIRSWLAGLGAALLLTACSAPGPIGSPDASSIAVTAPASLYVVRRGWHIDVGFSAEQLAAPLSALRAQFPGVRFVLFGFGDRHYLEARDRGLPDLAGALRPGDGLILVTALNIAPAEAFGARAVVQLPLTTAQASAAQQWLLASLALRDGALQPEGPGPYEGSAYLRASARYSALHTCNTWAAELLQASGLPVRSRGVLFAGQLWRQLHP
jgi:hypothetical protein